MSLAGAGEQLTGMSLDPCFDSVLLSGGRCVPAESRTVLPETAAGSPPCLRGVPHRRIHCNTEPGDMHWRRAGSTQQQHAWISGPLPKAVRTRPCIIVMNECLFRPTTYSRIFEGTTASETWWLCASDAGTGSDCSTSCKDDRVQGPGAGQRGWILTSRARTPTGACSMLMSHDRWYLYTLHCPAGICMPGSMYVCMWCMYDDILETRTSAQPTLGARSSSSRALESRFLTAGRCTIPHT